MKKILSIIVIALVLGGIALTIKKHTQQGPVRSTTREATIGRPEQELGILHSATVQQVLREYYDPSAIASDGAMGRNRAGFSDVAGQWEAVFVVFRGIGEQNREMIDTGIQALEYGFAFQDEHGGFKQNQGGTDLQATTIDAFFLQAVLRAALVIEASQYREQFAHRFEALRPQIAAALDWLAEPASQNALMEMDKHAPNRLLFNADAYALGGVYFDREDLHNIGDEFVKAALALQLDTGVFQEGAPNGHDSSYQGVALLKLEPYVIWGRNGPLVREAQDALALGVAWEKTRIDPETGEISAEGNTRTGNCQEVSQVSGACKDINYPQVLLALAYWSAMADDAEARALVEKSIEFSRTLKQ